LSLEAPIVMNFTPMRSVEEIDQGSETKSGFSLLLEPRSLLVFRAEAYDSYMHGIEDVHEDKVGPHLLNWVGGEGDTLPRKRRVSLTIRIVPKVLKANLGRLFGARK